MELIRLGDIIHFIKGKKPKVLRKVAQDGDLPYVDIKAAETGSIENYTNGEKCVPCEEGDLLIVCDGSRSGLVLHACKGYVGSTLAKISADGVLNEYLRYFIMGLFTMLNTQMKGTGTPHLNKDILNEAKLYLPPLAEQERIVARIEELFSELDQAEETLLKTQEALKLYRMSVLKTAFAELNCNYLTIEELASNDKYSLGIGPFGSDLKVSDYTDYGVRLVFVRDITNRFHNGNIKYVSETKANQLKAHITLKGDVLVTKMGDPPGECCIYPLDNPGIVTSDCIKVRVDEEKVLKDFLKYFILSPQGKAQISGMTKGVAQKKISLARFKKFTCPVPDLATQEGIISDLRRKLYWNQQVFNGIMLSLTKSKALRQSILKKAFEGGL